MGKKEYRLYAYRLQMVKEREIEFIKGVDQINNSVFGAQLIKQVIWQLGQTDRENFVVVMMNSKLVPIGANLSSVGGLCHTVAEPREIVKAALNLPCSGLILGHNHPSTDLTPSSEDTQVTRKIMVAAMLFDISVFDHIIVDMDSDRYYSFSDHDSFAGIKKEASNLMGRIRRN
jgi:DNA repair protein RadC